MKTVEQERMERTEKTETTKDTNHTKGEVVQEIAIERVMADPEQPRKSFDLAGLQGLAESIKENGIVQPLIVREVAATERKEHKADFTLVAGERRLRAAKLAGLKSVPCIVRSIKNVFGAQMVENLQRENLSALEEAGALGKQIEKGKTAEELAKSLGISRATLYQKLRLNSLGEGAKTELLRGNITASVAGLVAMVPGDGQKEFLKEVLPGRGNFQDGPMSYRAAEELLERNFARQLGKASFDTKAAYVWEEGMAAKSGGQFCVTCEVCPKRTGNMEGCGLKNPNVCTNVVCFGVKVRLAGEQKAHEAKLAGRTVIEGKEAEKVFNKWNEDLEYNSGFVELSARADVLGWDEKKTYGQVLEKAEEVPVAVAIDREGRARELVKREDAVRVLKAAGKIKAEKADPGEARWKKEQAQRQAEEKIRKAEVNAITSAIVAKIEALPSATDKLNQFWFVVADTLGSAAGFYVCEPVRKRRGWESGQYNLGLDRKELVKMTAPQLAGVAVELACQKDEEAMNAVCKALKIDQKKLAKEAREGLKKKKGKGTTKGTKDTKREKAKVGRGKKKSK